ncbi:denticleless protein homolog [Ptychodera flava]|uniref:denticleless protein homolog n=1 Tax=Ptychodera flava TaxID=63121 RepID=UPI00396A8914
MIWDTRCNKRVSEGDSCTPVDVIRSAHINTSASTPRQRKKTRLCNTKPANDSQQSVTAIIFQDEHSLISAGAMDGAIKIWDLRKNYNRNKAPTPRHVFPYAGSSIRKRGFSNLLLDSTSSRMFASCTDNIIYQYDCAGISTAPVAQYTGHLHSSFYVKASLSPNDEFLLSGSSDDNGYIWQVGKSEKPLYQLQGHANEVTSVAWNHKDFFKLVTCSDDNTVKVWRLNKRAEPLPINERSGWCTKYISTGASAESTVSNHANGNTGSNDVTVIQTSISSTRASTDSQLMTMRPLSPLLARSAPTSPVSSSPNAAATLPVTPPQCNMNRKYVSPKLRDSSIKKWLDRKQLVKQGTLKKSPRKSPVKEKENVSGSADDGTLRGVKRKIEDDERFSRENKVKVCEETTFNTGDLQPLEQHFVMEPEEKDVQKLSEINVNVESNDVVTASPKTDKVRNMKGDESFCRSPTINLPNLVLDSPKKTSGQQQLNCQGEMKKKQTNWLSQLTRQKKLLNSEDVVPSKQTSPSNGKNSPKLTKVMRASNKDLMSTGSRRPLSPKMPQPTTPTSPKSPNTRCIRHYFQPVSSRNEVQK